MRARRALLYMPGDDLKKIQKATTLGVDCICMDMEDGVALNRKGEARKTIAQALRTLDFGKSEYLARINAVGTGLETDDLDEVLPAHPAGIVIPKIEYAEQIQWASVQIARAEREFGWPKGKIPLLVGVESARGIINLAQIAAADPRLEAVIFGADDFASDVGATRTPEAREVFYARSAVITYAAAYGLQAIDMVYTNFHDSEGLIREALEGARMAFAGKQIIHPNQVIPVQEAFTPSDEAIAHAVRLMQEYEKHQQAGIGAFVVDGKMVDAPIVKAAERVIALAQAAGKL
ncbi:MAG: CoA ester lyase [Anaerolineales bacterium]|nr:CoA ester lyase [Anaerolineales bacterium]